MASPGTSWHYGTEPNGEVRFALRKDVRVGALQYGNAHLAPFRYPWSFSGWNRLTGSLRLSAYGIFSLKAGLISDSGFHCSPYKDL